MKTIVTIAVAATVACGSGDKKGPDNVLIDLWTRDRTAFGVFVPNERTLTAEQRRSPNRPGPRYTVAGGRALAENPLYDFVFLNLEGEYDRAAVAAIAEGLRAPSAVSRKTLLVRIPSIADAGAATTRTRVAEVLALGADGVVLPHVRSPDEAAIAISFFTDAEADVWSPVNPDGAIIAMLMVEDPDAVARAAEFADLPGYSVLACGIGSLTRAMGGDRAAAEAANLRVLAEATRAGLADMITANATNVDQRIAEGFPALLMSGPNADDVIRTGRIAAGR